METPSPVGGEGAGSGQVGKGGRVNTTPSPWPQPEPAADPWVTIGEAARHVVADIALRTGRPLPPEAG